MTFFFSPNLLKKWWFSTQEWYKDWHFFATVTEFLAEWNTIYSVCYLQRDYYIAVLSWDRKTPDGYCVQKRAVTFVLLEFQCDYAGPTFDSPHVCVLANGPSSSLCNFINLIGRFYNFYDYSQPSSYNFDRKRIQVYIWHLILFISLKEFTAAKGCLFFIFPTVRPSCVVHQQLRRNNHRLQHFRNKLAFAQCTNTEADFPSYDKRRKK